MNPSQRRNHQRLRAALQAIANPKPDPSNPSSWRMQLANQMDATFNNDELDGITFELDISTEELAAAAASRAAAIRALIRYCERQNTITQLITICKRLRPHTRWPKIKKKN